MMTQTADSISGLDVDPHEVEEAFDVDAELYVPFEYSITSYGADYPVDGLVKHVEDGSIYVPSFQRGYVWNINRASRFIESLLLGLPIPGIVLSIEGGTAKHLVIDGQQRLKTLQYFYGGIFKPLQAAFHLRNVHHKFNGKGYKDLEDEDRRRLDDAILHATIIRQEQPESDDSSIYHIFERLNTGGMMLQPQEIRSCVYHGPFSDLLQTLNYDSNWRELYGAISTRMRDQELILRFLALLYAGLDNYRKPMKECLNRFMLMHRNLDDETAKEYEAVFANTVAAIVDHIGERAFKPVRTIKAAVADAIMVGVGKRLRNDSVQNGVALRDKYDRLLRNNEFTLVTESATTDEENVRRRISLAIDAFGDVQ